ncbi:Ig-like domain-containing protein [cf. Phormidesmis sp. LEGE 11477]|uniref:Ig-like domain-containing protein n=1 Tax=cf. Phormidesmis sp. LEGE 11477 TaxID=1828680 RepID=UPI001880A679|nr:Ig-like domain-containing protein [cf. Phormidesmis sp. LEGE 11477]MBE9060905.1 cadherin-like domain-containing protein [cf. Phormidesmis sp. LEGE 11477]
MDTDIFELLLDALSPIDENGIASITGSIVGLGVSGSDVSLSIDFGDLSAPTPAQLFTVSDDGTGADQVAGDGIIEFAIPNLYFDDDPSGTPFDVYDIDIEATEQVLSGTDAVFVIDRSGSTSSSSGIDVNGDGIIETISNRSDSILQAEIAAFRALNQNLIDRGLGDVAKVSISAYNSIGVLLDLDPVTDGVQTFTTPSADVDNDGVLDVEQALDSLSSGGFTSFSAGLQQAITAVETAGTAPGGGSVIFLSDGFSSGGALESETIRDTLGQNLRAFGVGTGSRLSSLQVIDPDAVQFTDIQELLDVFAGVSSNVNRDSGSSTITINNVAPDIELDQLGDIDENSTLTLTGMFTDPGTLDTYTATIDWGDGTSAEFALSTIGDLSVGDSVSSTSDGSEFTVTAVDAATGEVSFSVDHLYAEDGPVTISASISDDDTGTDTDTVELSVLPIGDANQAPDAVDDSFNTNENVVVNGNVLSNDSDPNGDDLSATVLTDVSNGQLDLDADGSFTYTPNAGFSGEDSFTYEVSDGELTDSATVTVEVEPIIDPPSELTLTVEKLVDGNGDGVFGTEEVEANSGQVTFQVEVVNTSDVAITIDAATDSAASPAELAQLVGQTLAAGESITVTYEESVSRSNATTIGTNGPDALFGEQLPAENEVVVSASNGGLSATASSTAVTLVDANDLIAGGLGADTIDGGGGDDILRGDLNSRKSQVGIGGDDVIFGGAGRDRIGGKGGNDTLFGGDDDDQIWGDDGDDIIRGGAGNDTLTGDDSSGGQGADTFVLADGEGTDTITDFEINRDFIGLADGLSLGSLSFDGETISLDDQTLAILTGVDTTALTATSFVPV